MLVHGQEIEGPDVERVGSAEFNATQFASLCNDIVWALGKYDYPSVPSFTGRVGVRDGGVDAEWQIDDAKVAGTSSPLLAPGRNVFQYKLRNIYAGNRKAAISGIRSKLKGAFEALKRDESYPDSYVLFANADLTLSTGDKGKLKRAILDGYEGNEPRITIVSAAELASFLNDLPHLRSAYFATTKFQTWNMGWQDHLKRGAPLASKTFAGRKTALKSLSVLINDPETRAIIISGPPSIGKTRLALEATRDHSLWTVTTGPGFIEARDLVSLGSLDKEAILIVDEPESKRVDNFVGQAVTLDRLKLIITTGSIPELASISLTLHDRSVQTVKLDSLSNSEVETLLTEIGVTDYSFRSWIIKWAGGNPGLILEAAALDPDSRKEPGSAVDKIGKRYEEKTRREFGDSAIETLKLLSVLTYVGVDGTARKEIELICELFGNGITVNSVLNKIDELKGSPILQLRGSYVAVSAPYLAYRLAILTLRGPPAAMHDLYAALDKNGQSRLLSRLQTLTGDEADSFWDGLFDDPIFFGDLHKALANDIFFRAAVARPERITRFIETKLTEMGVEGRLGITGPMRSQLVWTLQGLAVRRHTSLAALRCLAMLAEAETETYYSNNATGFFSEYFNPHHPQIPSLLQDRYDFLKRILGEEHSTNLGLVAIKAAKCGIDPDCMSILYPNEGLEPHGSRPAVTYDELWDYKEKMLDLLMTAVQSEDIQIADAARDILPRTIYLCILYARPLTAVQKFEIVVNWVLQHKADVAIHEVVGYLKSTCKTLGDLLEKARGQKREEVRECIEKVGALLKRIDSADLSVRLRRWVSDSTSEGNEFETLDNGTRMYRGDTEIKSLAEEILENPDVLGGLAVDDLAWLCSEKAKRSRTFFFWLGKLDSTHKRIEVIEQLGSTRNCAAVFEAYFTGLSTSDSRFVIRRLHSLVKTSEIDADVILAIIGRMDGNLAHVKFIEQLISKNQLSSANARHALTVTFVEPLSSRAFLRLLKAIAGSDLEEASTTVDLIHTWLLAKRPIGERLEVFICQALAAPSAKTTDDYYHYDSVAANLAQVNKEQGFKLLAYLLKQTDYDRSWNPLREDQHEFWDALLEIDHDRALRTVMEVSLDTPENRFQITWDLSSMINLKKDKDFLTRFALEGINQALLVCECLEASQAEFWPIASEIIERFGSEKEIQERLGRAAHFSGKSYWGPESFLLKKRLTDVDRMLEDRSMPSSSRHWLEGIGRSLRDAIKHLEKMEANTEIADLHRY